MHSVRYPTLLFLLYDGNRKPIKKVEQFVAEAPFFFFLNILLSIVVLSISDSLSNTRYCISLRRYRLTHK